MRYIYKSPERCDGMWKDANGYMWGYQKKIEDVPVVADMRRRSRLQTNDFLQEGKTEWPVEPCQKKTGMFQKIRGYVECIDENGNRGAIRIIERSRVKMMLMMIVLLAVLGGIIFGIRESLKPADDTPIRIASGEMTNPNPENIRLPGIERIYADAGDTHVTQQLLNVEGNAYNLQYTIELEETGEVLYKSKVIEPGYGVREFELNRVLEKGQYTILITVNSSALEESDGSTDAAYNAGQLEAMLIVE